MKMTMTMKTLKSDEEDDEDGGAGATMIQRYEYDELDPT
jgi:hypothetical protein